MRINRMFMANANILQIHYISVTFSMLLLFQSFISMQNNYMSDPMTYNWIISADSNQGLHNYHTWPQKPDPPRYHQH